MDNKTRQEIADFVRNIMIIIISDKSFIENEKLKRKEPLA